MATLRTWSSFTLPMRKMISEPLGYERLSLLQTIRAGSQGSSIPIYVSGEPLYVPRKTPSHRATYHTCSKRPVSTRTA